MSTVDTTVAADYDYVEVYLVICSHFCRLPTKEDNRTGAVQQYRNTVQLVWETIRTITVRTTIRGRIFYPPYRTYEPRRRGPVT